MYTISPQEKNDAKLVAGEELDVFGKHPTVMLLIDPGDGRILKANAAAADYYGWSIEQLRRMNIADITILPTGGALGFCTQLQHRLQDGQVRNVEVRSATIEFHGEPIICSIIVDITEKTQAFDQLREKTKWLGRFVDGTSEMLFVKDEEYRYLMVNRAAAAYFNKSEAELIGLSDFDLMPLEAALICLESDQAALEEVTAVVSEERIGESYFETTKFPLVISEKKIGIAGIIRNVTARKQAEAQLLRGAEVQLALRKFAEAAFLAGSLDELYGAVYRLVSKVMLRQNLHIAVLDAENNQIVVPHCVAESDCVPRCRPFGKGLVEYAMRLGQTVYLTESDIERLHQTGEVELRFAQLFDWLGIPLKNSKGEIVGVLVLFSLREEPEILAGDIEILSIIAVQLSMAIERKRTEAVLRESAERFSHAMESSDVGIVDIDLTRHTLRLSPQWQERLDLPNENGVLRWEDFLSRVHPVDDRQRSQALLAHLKGEAPLHESEYRLKLNDGSWMWVLSRAKAMRDASQTPVRLIGTLADITELKHREEREKYGAEHDELTGLYSRRGFAQHVADILETERSGALMLLDIDDFKLINDVYGHAAGDQYLEAFGQYLRESFEKDATLARFGGDEFILFFPGRGGLQQATRAFEMMETVWLDTPAGSFFVQMSCGISVCSGFGDTLELLTQQADMALNQAKKNGKWCCKVYEPSLMESVGRRHAVREALYTAMGNNEFKLVYQPIFDIRHERESIVGFEALLRWESPALGMVAPAEFIPMAESTNLILPIGQWVLEEACRFSLKIKEKTGRFINIAVNVSVRQLGFSSFVTQVMDTLNRFGVPASSLTLEITESIMLTDVETSVGYLSALRDYGVGISLDDFGTGYSSFTYLAKLPITTLKIDKSLVDDLTQDGKHNTLLLLESLLHMSDLLGYKVVAEGVERPEQLRLLKEKGCDRCQGYLLGKPQPEKDILGCAEGLEVLPALELQLD